jgi:hypothetical protein
MESTATPRLTEPMLPATRAIVVRRQMRGAIIVSAVLGAISMAILTVGLPVWSWRPDPEEGSALVVLIVISGMAVFGGGMLILALYGLITRDPRTILLARAWVTLLAVLFLIIVGLGGRPWRQGWIDAVCCLMMLGVVVTAVDGGIVEMRRSVRILSWIPEIEAVSPEEFARVDRILRDFVACDEDIFEGRILTTGTGKRQLRPGFPKGCRGQLVENGAILVAKECEECFTIARQALHAASYNDRGGVVVQTDAGRKRLSLGPQSTLSVKQWAGVAVTAKDIARAVKRKKAPAPVLSLFLAADDAAVRLAVLAGMMELPDKGPAAEAAQRLLGDAEPSVRAAALEAVRKLAVPDAQAVSKKE